MDQPLLIALLAMALLSALALLVPGVVADREDVVVRAVRTFVQTALGLLLAAWSAETLAVSWALNLLAPAVVAGAAVVHSAIQPAVKWTP